MQRLKRIKSVMLCIALMIIMFTVCENTFGKQSDSGKRFSSFRDIPGVTAEEIAAIEVLQKQYTSFVYGVTRSTEAFKNENGEIDGFSALLCEYLTELFNIRFEPRFYDYQKLYEMLTKGETDFTGAMRPTEEHKKNLLMTEEPIARRSLVIVRIEGSRAISQIEKERIPRYAVLKNSAAIEDIASVFAPGSYKAVPIEFGEFYQTLKNGRADCFVAVNTAQDVFDSYGDLVIETFYPLVFAPVPLTARKHELAPIISCLDKALKSGDINYLNDLYDRGYNEYKKHRYFKSLTKEEREYIKNNPTVVISAVNWFYPVNFYNKYEKRWEGIAFDTFDEVTKITGINFTLGNGPDASWAEIYEKLEAGEIPISPHLIYTKDRAERYIWSPHIYLSEKYALVSKQSFPDISLNKIAHAKIGLMKNMAYTEMFNKWFPDASNVTEYESQDAAFRALDKGEIDLIMTGTNTLSSITSYYEYSNYKANFIFDYTINYSIAFNKNEKVLYSVIEKALQFIDIQKITKQWESRTYDYQKKVLRAQRPWLIGVSVLSLIVLLLVTVLLVRSSSIGKRLEKLVKERTHDLEEESSRSAYQADLLQAIIDTLPNAVFCKDLNKNYTLYNKFFAEFTGVDKNSGIGKNSDELMKVSFDDLNQKTIDEGGKVTVETWMPTLDGTKRLFEISEVPFTQNGAVVGIVGIAYDITSLKEMQEAALAASRYKSAFLANMSHEMRTPMNVVVGLTDLMLEEDDPTVNLKENLKKISTAGNTLLGLINDVLDISKIEAGKLELMPVQYDIPSLLSDIITLNMIRIEDKSVTFTLDINEKLPCSLFGDDLRVKQIINNLLSNAFKYTQKGNVTMGMSCEKSNGGNDVWMSIYVSDTGIGIRDEDLKKLFTNYSQVDTRTNRSIEGTGLGLSITKMLVEHMDGEISVESEYGEGTTFSLRIRQGFVSDKTIGAELAESLRSFSYLADRKRAHTTLVRPDLSYACVLVVDDMQTNLDVAAGMLKKYKMRVDCVISGKEAVNRIKEGEPVYDAIFMDHMMPEMDGVEATKAIRSLGTKYAMTIPIIALTANAIAGNEQMFLNNDFQAFLAKPINIMNLDSIVQRWVRDKSRE